LQVFLAALATRESNPKAAAHTNRFGAETRHELRQMSGTAWNPAGGLARQIATEQYEAPITHR
jgi:hypothetical protein